MKILALDTALEACSVAVLGDEGRPVILSEIVGRGHSERLFGMIEAAMGEAGLAFADLDRIGVTIGPGSFTGLRVGIAAARGFGLVTGCPIAGIGTLDVHAATARRMAGNVAVLAVLDARRGELYGQRFRHDGAPSGPPAAAPPHHFAGLLEDGDAIAGSGADLVAAAAGVATQQIVHRSAAPDVADLLRLAMHAGTGGAPRPLYLRPPDAKPQERIVVRR